MSKNFTEALKVDLREKGITYEVAAAEVGITTRQFIRQAQGGTKTGLMPVYMVQELLRKGIIDEGTGRKYLADVEEAIFRQKAGKKRLWAKIKSRLASG